MKNTNVTAHQELVHRKYRDKDGNVYAIEQASNRNWIVTRRNPGGNRKCCKHFAGASRPQIVQSLLDQVAENNNWQEVPE